MILQVRRPASYIGLISWCRNAAEFGELHFNGAQAKHGGLFMPIWNAPYPKEFKVHGRNQF